MNQRFWVSKEAWVIFDSTGELEYLIVMKHMGVSKNRLSQNGWFIMETPIKIDDMGGTPIFWNHPYNGMSTSLICMTSLVLGQQQLSKTIATKADYSNQQADNQNDRLFAGFI